MLHTRNRTDWKSSKRCILPFFTCFCVGCGLFVDLDDTPLIEQNGGPSVDQTNLTSGQACSNGGELVGSCNPVTQNCPDDQSCLFRADLETGTLISGCVDSYVGGDEGEPCSNNRDCDPGLFCVEVCVRYCERATGLGCDPEQSCTEFDPANAIGQCSDFCD